MGIPENYNIGSSTGDIQKLAKMNVLLLISFLLIGLLEAKRNRLSENPLTIEFSETLTKSITTELIKEIRVLMATG
ncbi:hypothetical protein [Anaerotignum propionicum]|uniref:hypothetical protein n=1 Tax=Anaerotignum propionicum TaxID=28446 RepID=UPI00289DCE95|nr:hypothetical protein [Anaerotignum propionicum]